MSSLWTPGGERPVGRPAPGPPPPTPDPVADDPVPEDEAALAARMAQLRDQLASTPAELVVANHAYGLFELAALHLGLAPPQLGQARTAIDALAALVEGMAGRLGEHEDQLRDALAQLRLAYVQLDAAGRGAAGSGGSGDPAGSGA